MRMLATALGLSVAAPALAGGLTLDVSGDCPGPASFSITGVSPGSTVGLIAGTPGSAAIPAGPCAGVRSDLAGLRLITTLRDADRDGAITFRPTLPGGACGLSVQVVDVGTCDLSNVELLGGGPEVDLDLTPVDGGVVSGDDPYWADKGYMFTASRDFTIAGGSWQIDMPLDGYVRMSVYDGDSLELLARGSTTYGSGAEEWLRSDLAYGFEAGNSYLVTFYTNRAGSSLFTRRDGPSYGYSVDGLVDGVTGWSSNNSGDDAPEGTDAGGYLGNTWAPYQMLHVVE